MLRRISLRSHPAKRAAAGRTLNDRNPNHRQSLSRNQFRKRPQPQPQSLPPNSSELRRFSLLSSQNSMFEPLLARKTHRLSTPLGHRVGAGCHGRAAVGFKVLHPREDCHVLGQPFRMFCFRLVLLQGKCFDKVNGPNGPLKVGPNLRQGWRSFWEFPRRCYTTVGSHHHDWDWLALGYDQGMEIDSRWNCHFPGFCRHNGHPNELGHQVRVQE